MEFEPRPLSPQELQEVDVAAAAIGKKEGQKTNAEVRAEISELMGYMPRAEFLDMVTQLAAGVSPEERDQIIENAKRERQEAGMRMQETEEQIKMDRVQQVAEEAREGTL